MVGVAAMVAGMFHGHDPWKVVPERYRPGREPAAAPARPMTPEERALALQRGVILMGQGLMRRG